MRSVPFILFLAAIMLTRCSESADHEPALYFRGGMDSVTIINNSGSLTFNGWNSLKNHEYVRDFDIANSGSATYAYQEITSNPLNAEEKVLRAVVLDDDPNYSATTRAQITMRFEDAVDLDVYHTSVRMYFPEDVEFLQNYTGNISWFVIFEAWTKRNPDWDGNSAGSARWNVNINKDESSETLYWFIESQKMQPAAEEQVGIWGYSNKLVSVPIEQWFTLDVYLKRGEGGKGRFVVKMTPDGGKTRTLFDVQNTTIYPEHPELPLLNLQAFKFYFSDTYLDWSRANGRTLSCYYNDFKWYKN